MSHKTDPIFKLPVRIYYEDTDAGGIVYYANYLKFMERARTEWLRCRGFEQDELRATYGIIFVVRKVSIDYLLPAFFNDQLLVTVEIKQVGKTHISCLQQVYKRENEEEHQHTPVTETLITEATVDLVCIDVQHLRPKRLPESLKKQLTGN